MNSIEYRFKKIQSEQPSRADFGVLKEAVGGRGYNHRTIRENFLKLVSKEDYEPSIEKKLIDELYTVSNTLMDDRIEMENENLNPSIFLTRVWMCEMMEKSMDDRFEGETEDLILSSFDTQFMSCEIKN